MKQGLKTFLWRVVEFSVFFFILDYFIGITTRPFPLYPIPEFFGTILLYILVGSAIAGIPFYSKLWKKVKLFYFSKI